ncbi:MAG: transglycosylase domain-containing protein [Candidatus Paceibacterota bacterium]|jgi:membrane peptidoglycan carboxypeptidase
MHKKKGLYRKLLHHLKSHTLKDVSAIILSIACVAVGIGIFWVSSFRLPDLTSFDQRRVSESTKIYDRTGKVLLFDLHDTVKRTVVAGDSISPYIKKATVAIEDRDFYTHGGIKVSSIIRAIFANLTSGGYSQGGSTITQQVVKNTVLTTDKTISRKLKEWVLAVKLDKQLPKDKILEIYLNETAYGGNMYGVEEAAQQFFGTSSKDVTLAQATYLASIPQATTYFSPYGKNRDKLEARKNLVLNILLDTKQISQAEYDKAKAEKVTFSPQTQYGIRAPHFVFFVKKYLEGILGTGALDSNGYKVITTLNLDLQNKAESLVKATALSNKENFDAENAALVAIAPKTGEILSMVGSRDYFDKDIDGQFNAAISPNRQPGSTMKPIIYSEAFIKGYTPDTVVFDLETEFSAQCDMDGKPLNPMASTSVCYNPSNYDEKFRGPISLRDALAQSINIPAIKTLYLAGIKDSLDLAKDMGITSLTNADQYGLTLVLGGGEISLLEMTSAYGVFADDGMRVPYKSVLQVLDSSGKEVKLPSQQPSQALPPNIARTISSILSDNEARTPAYGPKSVLYFPGRDVAVKTGTTNNSVDAWTVGYTPNVVIGVWAGNNDNSPMVKKVAGQIVAPLWSSIMKEALALFPDEKFTDQDPIDKTKLKPVMYGLWQGGQNYFIDKISGKLATSLTPIETQEERVVPSIHSILYWVNKNDPLGPSPASPQGDPQFDHWETPVRAWALAQGYVDQDSSIIPTQSDDVHTAANQPNIGIQNIDPSKPYDKNNNMAPIISATGRYPLKKASLYINGTFVETLESAPFIFRFSPKDISNIQETNDIRVIGWDSVFNETEASTTFSVKLEG